MSTLPAPPDALTLRHTLGRYATGVTLVTCRAADGHPVGLTVNSFASASLDPPLITWCLRLQSPNLAAFDAAAHFAVNVLGAEHEALARRFATPLADKFAEGQWLAGQGGAPLLVGALAHLQCALEQALTVGDHRLYVGRVLALDQRPDGAGGAAAPAPEPLLFFGGRYHWLRETR